MKRLIRYTYYSYPLGCGCCSDSFSIFDMWEDGQPKIEDESVNICCDEEDLRNYLSHLEPFDIDPDSEWF